MGVRTTHVGVVGPQPSWPQMRERLEPLCNKILWLDILLVVPLASSSLDYACGFTHLHVHVVYR